MLSSSVAIKRKRHLAFIIKPKSKNRNFTAPSSSGKSWKLWQKRKKSKEVTMDNRKRLQSSSSEDSQMDNEERLNRSKSRTKFREYRDKSPKKIIATEVPGSLPRLIPRPKPILPSQLPPLPPKSPELPPRFQPFSQAKRSPSPTYDDVAEKIMLMMMKEFHSGKKKKKSLPFALGNLKAFKACFNLSIKITFFHVFVGDNFIERHLINPNNTDEIDRLKYMSKQNHISNEDNEWLINKIMSLRKIAW